MRKIVAFFRENIASEIMHHRPVGEQEDTTLHNEESPETHC